MAYPAYSPPKVTFCGAAQTVTGSMHLVEVAGMRLLLDCGLFQGPRAEARRRNREFPFAAHDVHAVILSHAHIDHCGNLPNLVRQGFNGPIYCTPATRDLTAVMLADSAKIQEEDAAFLNKRRPRDQPPTEPLYDRGDVHRTVRLLQPVGYKRAFFAGKGVTFQLVEAGHLLGSAMIAMYIDGTDKEHTITFTGDLGRKGSPILRDPDPIPPADLVISESTYGGRVHPPEADLAGMLEQVVRRTFERAGKLLIPAFSLGRTQTVLHCLHQLVGRNRLPPVPIFVDSPLALAATDVFRMHPECFDEETTLLIEDSPDLFGERGVTFTRTVEESKALNARKDPCIIIAASGMCETGRIVHHLKYNIEDPRTTILILSYQAPHTLGRRLVEKQPEVRIHDRVCKLNAEVAVLGGFSCHADHNELLAALTPLLGKTRKIRLVHGELQPAQALAKSLEERGFANVGIPAAGESVMVD